MNQFVQTRLFRLIKETPERSISVSEWEKAYELFACKVFTASAESDRVVFHNALCFSKAELVFRQSQDSPKKK